MNSIFQTYQCLEKFNFENFAKKKKASKQKFNNSKTIIGNNQKRVNYTMLLAKI